METSFLLAPVASPLVQLRRAVASDALKLKRTAALRLTLASGALPVLLSFLIYYFKGHLLLKPGQDPWSAYILGSWQSAAGLLLPLFVVLLTSLLLNVENKASGWKHLHAQPVGRGAVFGSKLLLLLGLNLLAQLVYVALLLTSGWALGLLRPELHFHDHSIPFQGIGTLFYHTFIATLGLLAIQYVASLLWKSFVAPVALGMGATITALVLMRWEHIDWIPYAAPLLSLGSAKKAQVTLQVAGTLSNAEWISLGWFAVVLLVGYTLLRWRQE
ncbi:ABC transporter permease [Hymenobacter koreensis]|uniref:ABC transporter permease n=1 Tax=Hymenobacter koreensis TaxID=1084523 RepID=A0ABP8IWX7_9BACT